MMVATKTSLAGYEVPGTFEAVRAGALFVSALQPGDHPDAAVARMSWALATINTIYPAPSTTPAPGPRSLAFAS
jgi:hypothetical protein